MNLVQRLVRAISTIGVIQNDGIHFFIAGKCTNQAKPLLRRFSAGSPNLAFLQRICVLTSGRLGARSTTLGDTLSEPGEGQFHGEFATL